MKGFDRKWCLPVAVVFLAAPGLTHAQSSVTFYGLIDAGAEYVNHTEGGGTARMLSGGKNSSRFGLRGTEDLGAGLKAIFRLEGGFDLMNGRAADGGDTIFGRRATIGLQGKWGQLTLGRTFTTTYDYLLPFDPMGYSQNYSWATAATATGKRKDGLLARSSNVIRYDGKANGFKFGAMYGFGNVAGSLRADAMYGVALGYEAGRFAAVATFDRRHGARDTVSPGDRVDYTQGIHAGISYRIGAAKVMAGYRDYRRAFVTGAGTLHSGMAWFGGSYQVTPALALYGAVYHQDIKDVRAGDPTLLSLRATYALSKRTILYASGGYALAKRDRAVSLSRERIGLSDAQAGLTVGMQHRF
jgi:predicted porin